MKLKQTLTRRLGPVALWVWLLAGGAAVVLYRHFKSSSSTTGVDTSTAAAGTTGDPGLGAAAVGGGGGGDIPPMQPTAQLPVDPSIGNGGTGTPVVYDPYVNANPPDTTLIPAVGPAKLVAPYTGTDLPTGPGGFEGPLLGWTDTTTPGTPTTTTLARPATTRGQATKKKKPPPAYQGGSKVVSVSHPNAKTTITTLASGARTEQVAGKPAYAISPVRSAPAAAPDNVRTVAPGPKTPPAPVRAAAPSPAPIPENSPAAQPKPATTYSAPKPGVKPVQGPSISAFK